MSINSIPQFLQLENPKRFLKERFLHGLLLVTKDFYEIEYFLRFMWYDKTNLIEMGDDGYMRQKLLVVDDEKGIVDMMAGYFAPQYDVLTAYSGQEALSKVTAGPDLILLDINMPGLDGLAVCRKIREYVNCPILFLTARIESADKIDGFRAGADDYIVKPFDLDELSARIEAHLRREQRRQNRAAVRFFGELAVDYTARTAAVGGTRIPLSRREFDIVELLSLNAGQVFDRERIYESIWGIDGEGSSDTIMEHIRRIRAKFAAHTLHSYIDTVWGCGYRWNG